MNRMNNIRATSNFGFGSFAAQHNKKSDLIRVLIRERLQRLIFLGLWLNLRETVI